MFSCVKGSVQVLIGILVVSMIDCTIGDLRTWVPRTITPNPECSKELEKGRTRESCWDTEVANYQNCIEVGCCLEPPKSLIPKCFFPVGFIKEHCPTQGPEDPRLNEFTKDGMRKWSIPQRDCLKLGCAFHNITIEPNQRPPGYKQDPICFKRPYFWGSKYTHYESYASKSKATESYASKSKAAESNVPKSKAAVSKKAENAPPEKTAASSTPAAKTTISIQFVKPKKFGYNPPECSKDTRTHEIVEPDNDAAIPCKTERKSGLSCSIRGCCYDASSETCVYPKADFVACYSDNGNVHEAECNAKGCHYLVDPLLLVGNPIVSKCVFPPNYKSYRVEPQCFDGEHTVGDRIECGVTGDLNEMNCRAAGCCWQPVLHNKAAYFCYHSWDVLKKPHSEQDLATCSDEKLKDPSNRFDCFPRGIPNEKTCHARNCCWHPDNKGKGPSCFYRLEHKSYVHTKTETNTTSEMSIIYKKTFQSSYPYEIYSVKMSIVYETKTRIRVKIYDNAHVRYESPYPKLNKLNNESLKDKLYDVEVGETSFGFAIKRSASNRILFDTRSVGGFIMSDQFLQISARLHSSIVYGLGRGSKPLKNSFDWSTIGLFAQDQSASHPFYLSIEEDGKAHGVFLHNSNALELVLQPTPAITYRAMGGILDFYFFMGEKPEDVINQYFDLIGKPFMPPFWGLGYQILKHKIYDDYQLMQAAVLVRKYPLDVLFGDASYLDANANNNTPKVVENFKTLLPESGIKYMSILEPGISMTGADIFIKRGGGFDNFHGKLSSDNAEAEKVYIDFTHPNASAHWLSIVTESHARFPFSGLYLAKNTPWNAVNPVQCPLTRWDDPPFVPQLSDGNRLQELKYHTICMSAKQHASVHYNLHNLYGISQAHATYDALKSLLKDERPFVISQSTFPGSGAYSGVLIDYGPVDDSPISMIKLMKQSLSDVLAMNMFGVTMAGVNIHCGSNSTFCNRWTALSSLYPLYVSQTLEQGNTQDHHYEAVRKLTIRRYKLLPYIYNVMQIAHRFGQTAVRPLSFQYPEDKNTYDVDDQFFLGDALLIGLPLSEKTYSEVYVPEGLWYWYPSFDRLNSLGIRYHRKDEVFPILIKGGSIIVTQDDRLTTTVSRTTRFNILVLLDLNKTALNTASYYFDDGKTNAFTDKNVSVRVDFEANGRFFRAWPYVRMDKDTPSRDIFPNKLLIESIKICHLTDTVTSVHMPALPKVKLTFYQQSDGTLVIEVPRDQELSILDRVVMKIEYGIIFNMFAGKRPGFSQDQG